MKSLMLYGLVLMPDGKKCVIYLQKLVCVYHFGWSAIDRALSWPLKGKYLSVHKLVVYGRTCVAKHKKLYLSGKTIRLKEKEI